MIAGISGGLEGVVASATQLSLVDGDAGHLILAGYAVEDIAPQASFEEMVHLFLSGNLPNAQDLKTLKATLASRRSLPAATTALMREAARQQTPAMDALPLCAA